MKLLRGWLGVVLLVALAGFVTKLPAWWLLVYGAQPGWVTGYYEGANINFFVLPFLIIFFCIRKRLSLVKSTIALGLVVGTAIYANWIGVVTPQTDSYVLMSFHIPFFLWFVLGITFIRFNFRGFDDRLKFLRYTGEMFLLSVLILVLGVLLTWLTSLLILVFDGQNIGPNLEWYLTWVVVYGAVGAPIVATHVLSLNPTIFQKVCPLLAKIFSPLLLVTVLSFLVATIYSGNYVSMDRNMLISFNVLLMSVMAIVIFSFIEATDTIGRWTIISTSLLACATLVLDGIALWSIASRISDQWGFTPNRIVVLGSNLLIFGHLVWILIGTGRVIRRKETVRTLHSKLVSYFPIYGAWSVFVVFVFPMISLITKTGGG